MLTMSATELRLDYKDLLAGRVTIVIDGLPTTIDAPAAAGLARTPASRPGRSARRGVSASPLVEEAEAIYDATAYAPVLGTSLVLSAWRGQEARAGELIAATIEDATDGDERRARALAEYARAVLCNGLGRYQEALAAAERACAYEDLGPFAWALLELIEAGARSNNRKIASEGLDRIEAWAAAGNSDWGRGVRARSAALLSEGVVAETLYQEAIDLLSRSRLSAHRARAQLVYGEWLRRENRRIDARAQLRAAHEGFTRVSARGFAERALRELLATGETARKRIDESRGYLTPQEAQIARLAQEGLSNPQIGAQLFISPRTVQYHLRKVFRKLEINSRRQLVRVSANRLGAAA
jgi:DNA-binding CsgD family transcriptional regulator